MVIYCLSLNKFIYILMIFGLGVNTSKKIKRTSDYDFVDADDLFVERSLPRRRNSSYGANGKNSSLTTSEEEQTNSMVYTASDSSIGYEAPCGLRGGNDTLYNPYFNDHRIVGGVKAQPGEFPWQVSLQLVSGWFSRHICGGAILSSYWVVTAGHCVVHLKPQALVVVAGDHDLFKIEGAEQRVKVVRIVSANYSRENFSSDIALLQLKPRLILDGVKVAPICLPNSGKRYQAGEYGVVSGWGKLSEIGFLPNVLHFVELPLLPINKCHGMYEKIKHGKYIHKCQLCCGYERGGSDSCQGDSGGPLACKHSDKRYYLCGIVSWGVGCARPNLPGVYTEVPCYSQWIKDVLYNTDGVVSVMPPYL